MSCVLAVDVGSSALKCALYDEQLALLAEASEALELFVDGAHVECDPDGWWRALRSAVPRVLAGAGVAAGGVAAVAFCAQMQGVVLVDEALVPVRRAIGYLDTRSTDVFARDMGGWPRIHGVNATRLLASVALTNIVPGSAKDPLWKVRWLAEHEPDVMARAHKWLDVKDWLVARCTGRACTTADSAHLGGLYTFNGVKSRYSPALCRLYGIAPRLLPEVVPGNAVAGVLRAEAARELGLLAGTPIVPGGGDISCVALGAGSVGEGDTHVYIGTSGWVGQATRRRLLDASHFMASLRTCLPNQHLYLGELQTAGACLSWATTLLGTASGAADYAGLAREAAESPSGARGLLFAPWLHGSRSPNEDAWARGAFFNLGLTHQRRDLVRAVFEGVALHLAWILDAMEEKVAVAKVLRFAGGGATVPLWGQCLADATGRAVEVIESPQLCGVRGAALLGLAAIRPQADVHELARTVRVARAYSPVSASVAVQRDRRDQLGQLYRANRPLFRAMAH